MDRALLAIRIGSRNLWRNPRRSLITICAVAAAYALLIGLIGLMAGLKEQLLRNGTRQELGNLQIHNAAYLPDRNIQDTIGAASGIDVARLLADLRSYPSVIAAAPRARGYGLISTGQSSAGAQFLGIDPGAEARVTTLLASAGSGTGVQLGTKQVLLGSTLAQEIGALPGGEVALVTQAADGSLGNDLFRVAGTLRTGLRTIDRSLVLMRMKDLQELLALAPGQIHEVAVLTHDPLAADSLCASINDSHNLPGHAVAQSWGDLAPQLKDYVNLSESFNGFIICLVALFSSLGILNTMMMAVFERTREIGMLGALGTSPMLINLSILLESLCLVLLGLAVGFGLGTLLMLHFTSRGWDLSRWIGDVSMLNTRMDPVLKGVWVWDQVLWAGLALAAAALLASFIPARRAAWMKPIEALTAPTAG